MATMYSATRPLMPLHKEGPRLQSPRYLPAWLRHRSAVRPQCEIAACAPAGKQVRAAQAATMHPPTRPGVPHVKRRRTPAISTLSAFAAAAQTRPCATGMLHGGERGRGAAATPSCNGSLAPPAAASPVPSHCPGAMQAPRAIRSHWLCHRTRDQVHMHQPGIEPGSHRWQRCILQLDH